MPRLIISTGLYQAHNRPILKTIRCHDLSLELWAILICCLLDFYIYLTSFHLISLLLQNSHPHLWIIRHSLFHLTLILQSIVICFFVNASQIFLALLHPDLSFTYWLTVGKVPNFPDFPILRPDEMFSSEMRVNIYPCTRLPIRERR
jgi:hypothetical protein